MTDARYPAMGSGSECPDFESLSCYADGEVDAATAAALGCHVAVCAHCATLTARLGEGLAAEEVGADGRLGGSGCVGEEHLVVYAAGGLTDTERAALRAHLGTCDACVGALVVLHRRLTLAATIATAVPTGVQHRARLALGAGQVEPAAERVAYVAPRHIPFLERLRGLLRVPVLVPVAVAAGALVMVGLQPGWRGASVDAERSRALAPQPMRLRVSAPEATVRSRPSMHSEVVTTVQRGATVEVAGEERDWYAVRLEGGRPGWMEREAFE